MNLHVLRIQFTIFTGRFDDFSMALDMPSMISTRLWQWGCSVGKSLAS